MYKEKHFWVKGTFGGLSWRWFSGKDGATGGVTIYTGEVRDLGRDSSQGPEENETRKMSLGYCDILHFERVWKGSNTNWEVKVTATNMSQLHKKTCYTAFIPSASEELIQTWKRGHLAFYNLKWCQNYLHLFWMVQIILAGDGGWDWNLKKQRCL